MIRRRGDHIQGAGGNRGIHGEGIAAVVIHTGGSGSGVAGLGKEHLVGAVTRGVAGDHQLGGGHASRAVRRAAAGKGIDIDGHALGVHGRGQVQRDILPILQEARRGAVDADHSQRAVELHFQTEHGGAGGGGIPIDAAGHVNRHTVDLQLPNGGCGTDEVDGVRFFRAIRGSNGHLHLVHTGGDGYVALHYSALGQIAERLVLRYCAVGGDHLHRHSLVGVVGCDAVGGSGAGDGHTHQIGTLAAAQIHLLGFHIGAGGSRLSGDAHDASIVGAVIVQNDGVAGLAGRRHALHPVENGSIGDELGHLARRFDVRAVFSAKGDVVAGGNDGDSVPIFAGAAHGHGLEDAVATLGADDVAVVILEHHHGQAVTRLDGEVHRLAVGHRLAGGLTLVQSQGLAVQVQAAIGQGGVGIVGVNTQGVPLLTDAGGGDSVEGHVGVSVTADRIGIEAAQQTLTCLTDVVERLVASSGVVARGARAAAEDFQHGQVRILRRVHFHIEAVSIGAGIGHHGVGGLRVGGHLEEGGVIGPRESGQTVLPSGISGIHDPNLAHGGVVVGAENLGLEHLLGVGRQNAGLAVGVLHLGIHVVGHLEVHDAEAAVGSLVKVCLGVVIGQLGADVAVGGRLCGGEAGDLGFGLGGLDVYLHLRLGHIQVELALVLADGHIGRVGAHQSVDVLHVHLDVLALQSHVEGTHVDGRAVGIAGLALQSDGIVEELVVDTLRGVGADLSRAMVILVGVIGDGRVNVIQQSVIGNELHVGLGLTGEASVVVPRHLGNDGVAVHGIDLQGAGSQRDVALVRVNLRAGAHFGIKDAGVMVDPILTRFVLGGHEAGLDLGGLILNDEGVNLGVQRVLILGHDGDGVLAAHQVAGLDIGTQGKGVGEGTHRASSGLVNQFEIRALGNLQIGHGVIVASRGSAAHARSVRIEVEHQDTLILGGLVLGTIVLGVAELLVVVVNRQVGLVALALKYQLIAIGAAVAGHDPLVLSHGLHAEGHVGVRIAPVLFHVQKLGSEAVAAGLVVSAGHGPHAVPLASGVFQFRLGRAGAIGVSTQGRVVVGLQHGADRGMDGADAVALAAVHVLIKQVQRGLGILVDALDLYGKNRGGQADGGGEGTGLRVVDGLVAVNLLGFLVLIGHPDTHHGVLTHGTNGEREGAVQVGGGAVSGDHTVLSRGDADGVVRLGIVRGSTGEPGLQRIITAGEHQDLIGGSGHIVGSGVVANHAVAIQQLQLDAFLLGGDHVEALGFFVRLVIEHAVCVVLVTLQHQQVGLANAGVTHRHIQIHVGGHDGHLMGQGVLVVLGHQVSGQGSFVLLIFVAVGQSLVGGDDLG
ncbi:MAG: hypothetical protein NC311_10445 [Muribaculaceae bacterium]|nr:hypothetical protein [Muribaculaceae bacterium]